jgi:thymidine phosphorylase
MANPALAAVSLLSKKVAVPGCTAVFDFRVGETGNIGGTVQVGRQAADLFHEIAAILGVKIGTVLTDNRTFPSSALGRLESLELMLSVLDGVPVGTELDDQHVHACVALAAEALVLAGAAEPTQAVAEIRRAIVSGTARETLSRHLSAQGGSEVGVKHVLRLRSEQVVTALRAEDSGSWQAPSLREASRWVKGVQKAAGAAAAEQIGLRLKVSPGAQVRTGQVVAEIRCPSTLGEVSVPAWLKGTIAAAPATPNAAILALRCGNEAWR